MAIRSDDITQIIKAAIEDFDATAETRSVGTVVEVGDGIARIYGPRGRDRVGTARVPGWRSWAWPSTSRKRRSAPSSSATYTQIKEGDTVKTHGLASSRCPSVTR